MMTTENHSSSQLPAHFLAYKQKAEEQANKPEGPRMGNANCWGSFSFLSTSTTNSSGIGSHNMNNNNMGSDNFGSSEQSHGSSPMNQMSPTGFGSNPTATTTSSTSASSKMKAKMWNSFSKLKSTVTGIDDLEVPQTHSAELESKAGFPTNKHMTNVDRLKSMAASAVQKPEIPDAPEAAPAPVAAVVPKQQHFGSQSSFPSLASSQSDGSSSLESTASTSRSWLGNKLFGASKQNKATGIGSHQDPSIGELNKDKSSGTWSSMMTTMTTKKVEEKKDIDIEKLKRLRDQAAGLVPQSLTTVVVEETKEEEKVDNLESQIDNLEKEMGLANSTPPRLRMDGFDDVHDASQKQYAEIKVTPAAVSHLDSPFNKGMPNKMASPSSASAGELSTAL